MADFPSILKDLRERNDLKKRELAEQVHVSPSMISQYESGRCMPSYETMLVLATYFDVSMDYLLGKSKSKNSSTFSGLYCGKVTQAAFMDMCSRLTPEYRSVLLTIVQAFLLSIEEGKAK